MVVSSENWRYFTTVHERLALEVTLAERKSSSAAFIQFLPECDYVTFGYRKSVCRICLSSVTFVRPTQGIEIFSNISSSFCTLAILWPPCKILWRSSQGNHSVVGVKRKRGSKIEWWWTYRRLYLIPMPRSDISSPDEFLVLYLPLRMLHGSGCVASVRLCVCPVQALNFPALT